MGLYTVLMQGLEATEPIFNWNDSVVPTIGGAREDARKNDLT